MTLKPKHISVPLEPSPAPPLDDPNAPSTTVEADGLMAPGGPQTGEVLTTSTGTRLYDTDHSLKAGERGPSIMTDHHLREKITHFDHERIPERVVHARGAGAHGTFVANGAAEQFTRAGFLADGVETPVFARFSTVIGSRGSSDTVRDTRGFAVKFYTEEGIFDLVGNNMPVFFIQDGIKFPDVVHAAKWHPDNEIPQAQTAHDTFWDFVSLHTEATHHVLWAMSDRGIPRSYRMMEGFGVNTYRLNAQDNSTYLVKFHWKPAAGVHSLVWEEAQITNGVDPDFHRRDLYEAINAGNFPTWDLGIQVMPDDGSEMFEGIDLLDPTKLVPEELCPVTVIGTLTLNRAPANFFAESEQVAFHVGHLVPGIEPTNDPLLQARLFSYIDTQITRLGGPNFNQIPINRPLNEVNDNLRDGMHQTQVHTGVAPYRPNSLGGGCPVVAGIDTAYVETPVPVEGVAVRKSPASFADHYTQAALFYRSLTKIEQMHLAEATAFELGKCHEVAVREREVAVLANVDRELAGMVAARLGLDVPESTPVGEVDISPALRQVDGVPRPPTGRPVAVVLAVGSTPDDVADVIDAAAEAGLVARCVVAPGTPDAASGTFAGPARTYLTARSIEFDAVILQDASLVAEPRIATMVKEAYRHGKAIGLLSGTAADAGIETVDDAILAGDAAGVIGGIATALEQHRAWDRLLAISIQEAPA